MDVPNSVKEGGSVEVGGALAYISISVMRQGTAVYTIVAEIELQQQGLTTAEINVQLFGDLRGVGQIM